MIAGRAFVTPHAVRRWQERIHRGASYEQARDEILETLEIATLRRRDEDTGVEHWRASKRSRFGRVRFRIGRGTGALPAVLSVLTEWDGVGSR